MCSAWLAHLCLFHSRSSCLLSDRFRSILPRQRHWLLLRWHVVSIGLVLDPEPMLLGDLLDANHRHAPARLQTVQPSVRGIACLGQSQRVCVAVPCCCTGRLARALTLPGRRGHYPVPAPSSCQSCWTRFRRRAIVSSSPWRLSVIGGVCRTPVIRASAVSTVPVVQSRYSADLAS